MAFTTYTSSTDVEELIPTELINDYAAGFEYPAPTGMGIAWQQGGRGNVPIRFPRWNQLSLSSLTQSEETDAFTEQEFTTTESSITPALHGFTLKIPDQVAAAAPGHVPVDMLDEALISLIDYTDTLVLASFTGGTTVAGAVTDDYTLSRLRADIAVYKALEIPAGQDSSGVALILSHAGVSDLMGSLHSSGATMILSSNDSVELGTNSGYQGRVHKNVGLFETVRVPNSSTGAAGALTPIGDKKCGFAIVWNEMPSVRATRGDTAESTASTWYHYRVWFGTGIVNPRRFVEVAHQR